MQPSNNFAENNLEGTLSGLHREDTDAWRTSNLLTSRKENAVNQLGAMWGGGSRNLKIATVWKL